MPEWLVRLTGPERDLRFLATALREPWWVTEEDGEFFLRSGLLDALGDAGEVRRLADETIGQANQAALVRFERYEGARTAGLVRVDPDGSRHRIATLSGHVKAGPATVRGFVTVVEAASKPSPPDLNADMALLKRQPALAEALNRVRDEPNWFGYWKAAEALGGGVGGLDKISELGWASDERFKRFRDTAHHHRHHRKPTPQNPMTEAEGREFVLGLLRRWIDWERSGMKR